MRITCPSCSAEYDVPGPLAPGRAVRCARCNTQWAPVPLPPPVEPPTPEPEPLPFAVPEPIRMPDIPAPNPHTALVPVPDPKPASRWPLLLAWILSAVIIAGLIAAAFVWRDKVMEHWPPSIRVYSALGLTAHP